MFSFMSRFLPTACKRLASAPTTALSSSLPGFSPLSSHFAPSLTPISFLNTAAFVAPSSSVLHGFTNNFASKSCVIASSIRHQTSDFTVRDSFEVVQSKRNWTDLERVHGAPPKPKRRVRLSPIGYAPHLKGVVLKTLIKKPKKPNSANRKCVLVRLSNGRECVALVPGEGHNLQEHSTVLCEARRTKDLIGVHVRVVRGKYDCAPVKKKIQ